MFHIYIFYQNILIFFLYFSLHPQGQCCCAGTRVYVQDAAYDEFVERSVELVKHRTIGDPFNPKNLQGPQVGFYSIKRDFC